MVHKFLTAIFIVVTSLQGVAFSMQISHHRFTDDMLRGDSSGLGVQTFCVQFQKVKDIRQEDMVDVLNKTVIALSGMIPPVHHLWMSLDRLGQFLGKYNHTAVTTTTPTLRNVVWDADPSTDEELFGEHLEAHELQRSHFDASEHDRAFDGFYAHVAGRNNFARNRAKRMQATNGEMQFSGAIRRASFTNELLGVQQKADLVDAATLNGFNIMSMLNTYCSSIGSTPTRDLMVIQLERLFFPNATRLKVESAKKGKDDKKGKGVMTLGTPTNEEEALELAVINHHFNTFDRILYTMFRPYRFPNLGAAAMKPNQMDVNNRRNGDQFGGLADAAFGKLNILTNP